MEIVREFEAFGDIPPEIRDMICEYYEKNDHRAIPNNSYSRYPHLFDWHEEDELTEIDEWFFSNGSTMKDGHVIIHWDW